MIRSHLDRPQHVIIEDLMIDRPSTDTMLPTPQPPRGRKYFRTTLHPNKCKKDSPPFGPNNTAPRFYAQQRKIGRGRFSSPVFPGRRLAGFGAPLARSLLHGER